MVYAVTLAIPLARVRKGTRVAPPAEIRAESPDEYGDERRPAARKNHQRIPAARLGVYVRESGSLPPAKFFSSYS